MISSFVLTGFLGVGKTTMLTNTVKEYFKNRKIAIVVNEFGDVGVDSKILSNVHSEVMEISEGCICCKLAQEFESGVMEIIQKYSPEIIFVETSGASEPFPIFLSLQNLGITVEGIICVVDSKNYESYMDNSTAQYQVGGSNIIVLNKTDLVTDDEIKVTKEKIKKTKEKYNIKNTLTGQEIFKNYSIYESQQGMVNKEVFEGIYKIEDIIEMVDDHKHHDHTSKDSLTQKVAYLTNDVSFASIEELLSNVPQNIFRIKGVIRTNDIPEPLFLNYSFGDVTYEPLNEFDKEPLLIFIGTDIESEVKSLCDKFSFINLPMFRINK